MSASAAPASSRISHFSFPVTERELAKLWQDQTFPPQALVAGDGERLRVIYRGRRGGGAGPDFRDALIAAPRRLLRGDVELHVRSSDFRRHGHHLDPAYAGVVLHLVFHDDEGGPTALPGGGSAPVAALADWVEGRAAEIARWLERPALWREPCFSAPGRLGPAQVAATLDRLGEMRFRQKAAAFARRMGEMRNEKGEMSGGRRKEEEGSSRPHSPLLPTSYFLLPSSVDKLLWEALLEALGYGGPPEPWRALSTQLPWPLLRGRLARLPPAERAPEAWRLLAMAGEGVLTLPARGRPAGRPERRLRGAATLAARFAANGLFAEFAALLNPPQARDGEPGEAESGKRKSKTGGREAPRVANGEGRSDHGERGEAKNGGGEPGETESEKRKTSTGWRAANGESRRAGVPRSRVSNFGLAAARRLTGALTVPGLIGRGRAVEIAANAVLPCLAALGPEARARRAEAAYGALPLPARYGAVRHLHEAAGAAVPVDARRQQGMLYLLRQYCTQGGCGRCPLS